MPTQRAIQTAIKVRGRQIHVFFQDLRNWVNLRDISHDCEGGLSTAAFEIQFWVKDDYIRDVHVDKSYNTKPLYLNQSSKFHQQTHGGAAIIKEGHYDV